MMSNNLLKSSSSWFLRPHHHQRTNLEDGTYSKQPSEIHIFLPPDEEYSIRKYCPLTLNHLLPDLYHTKKEQEEDTKAEFDTIMLNKFEKHLEESHPVVSCSSSSEEESDSKPENEPDLINCNNKPEKPKFRMKILLPNKVNYPQENMKLLLPDVVLNNKRLPSPILTKNFCTGCINRGMTLPTSIYKENTFTKYKNVERQKYHNMNVEKFKNSAMFPPVTDNTEITADVMKPTFCSKNFREDDPDESPKSIMNKLCRQKSYFSSTNFQNCRHRHRNSSAFSLSIHKDWNASGSPESPVETEQTGLMPPSPYMVELARLRREKLRIEEKMLLKKRQVLELERLRPPIEKWYEMKDQHFHHEARRNNIYVKNQKFLPLIEDRRRLLYETITS